MTMRSLDQIDLKDKTQLLKQLQQNGSKIASLQNENQENLLHLIASEQALKNSQSISGNKDMTLYEIVEFIIHATKQLAFKAERVYGQNPLHYAFKTGNIEVALWMMQIIKREQGMEAYSELFNAVDHDGMRPIDLLGFKIDDHHKQFIREVHNEEKNYKLSKQFDVYSWGHSDDYQLGYTQLNNERRYPKKITFELPPQQKAKLEQIAESSVEGTQDLKKQLANSIKDVKVSNTFSLALTEDGQVYSWGLGLSGHLGLRDENSRIQPQLIKIDLSEEEKRIKKLKKQHRNFEEVEELLTLHSFVKSASKNNYNLGQQQSFFEQEFNDSQNEFFIHGTNGSSDGKKNQKKMRSQKNRQLIQFQQEQAIISKKELDAQLILLQIDKPQVSRIACSNRHTLISTNTGSVFAWGENDQQQLGFISRKSSQPKLSNILYEATPRKIDQLSKHFIIDVSCGDYHSCVLSNLQEVFVWGSNKEGQLGIDMENCTQTGKATKVVLHEYMNSSNKEKFVSVKAKSSYTVLICETKNIYISDKLSNQFVPLYGKSGNNSLHKKLESSIFLASDYLLALDIGKSIYFYKVFSQPQNKHQQDVSPKRFATEIYSGSNFIELYPTDRDIWAVNSLRQLFVCRDFKKSNSIEFQPVNDVFNVMKGAIGGKHQVIIKIIKQLDDLMIRDIALKPEEDSQIEDPLDIPMPSSCLMDMGVSISGGSQNFGIQTDNNDDPELAEQLQYIPSLSDMCIQQISQSITLENALELYELADHLIIDELKVNCLKFISLNIVSYLETPIMDRLMQLPVYLIRDLENFIKLEDSNKYLCFDMKPIEEAEYNHNLQLQQKQQTSLTQEYCSNVYKEILDLFEEYILNHRLHDQVRIDLCFTVHKFKQQLRKSHKKLRKGSSNIANRKNSTDFLNSEDPEDFETIVSYLEMTNDFIKSNLAEEMIDYLKKVSEQEQPTSQTQLEQSTIESTQTFANETLESPRDQTIIIKKRKNNKKPVSNTQKPKETQSKLSSQTKTVLEEESIENYFLKLKDEKTVKQQEFEKSSIENDFLIVKQCDKKSNKVVYKSKHNTNNHALSSAHSMKEEKVLLSDLVGFQIKGPQGFHDYSEKKDCQPQADLWNYLDGQENQNESNNSQGRLRITSFEEIQKEELMKKNKKRYVQQTSNTSAETSSQANKNSNEKKRAVLKPVKEEDTKNDWGMIEEKDEIKFEDVLQDEKKKLEEQRTQLRRDEEIARRLLEEELRRQEEEMFQKVLKDSLAEYSKQYVQEAEHEDQLYGYHNQAQSNNQYKKKRGPRAGQAKRTQNGYNNQQAYFEETGPQSSQNQMKWVPKNKK